MANESTVLFNLTPWEDFYSFVRPMAQECPIGIIDAAIRAACIEFCQKSLIWTREAACGDVLKGARVYKYNYKVDGVSIVMPIACIIRETTDNSIVHHVLAPTNRQDLDYYDAGWRLREARVPTKFFMIDSNSICLVEKPTESFKDGLHLLCAVKPNRSAEGVADFIFEDWAEDIAYGALARIHAMAGRVWANPSLVPFYQSKFRAAISRAKSKVYKSYIAQSKTMLPVSFDGTTGPNITPGTFSAAIN